MAVSVAAALLARYVELEVIGQGNFGIVTLTRCKADGRLYVIKRVNLRGMKPSEAQGALQEVCALCGVGASNGRRPMCP
jgi:hypothetical protein